MSKVGEAYIVSPEKRAFDVLGSFTLATLAAPVAGTAALALCVDRGSVDPIFRQKRVGKHATQFLIYKLRTMAQQDIDGLSDTFGPLDPRASKLGKLIRQIGIDELPQVLNIIKGEMSLVGIRPQIPTVLEQRETVDSGLFKDWYYCYERNLGLFGAGQAYAHGEGYYKENNVTVRNIMELDIKAFETATLGSDMRAIVNQPLPLIRSYFNHQTTANA